MFARDGYTMFAGGTDVAQPGDDLLQVTIDYITANSPVDPLVEGRIVVRDRRQPVNAVVGFL